MEIQQVHVKPRAQFGKWCNFEENEKLQVDVKSQSALAHDYVRVDPVTQGTQCSKTYALHEVSRNANTITLRKTILKILRFFVLFCF